MTENLTAAQSVTSPSIPARSKCRLLYFGPAKAGKRDNLRAIYQSIPPEHRLSLAGDDPERRIAFQLNHGEGEQWQVLVQAVDSGNERYHSAGMPADPPFDGIVFVVDSAASSLDQDLVAFEALKAYVDSWGLDLMSVPVVIQYNGDDQAGNLPVERLESLLNPLGLMSFPANAKRGKGVREALRAILGLTVDHLESAASRNGGSDEALPEIDTSENVTRVRGDGLGIDYGPPVPGGEIAEATKVHLDPVRVDPVHVDPVSDERCPPVVIPVKIPGRLRQTKGPLRILLEVEFDDSDS